MRALPVVALLALLCPAAASAQTAAQRASPAPAAAPPPGAAGPAASPGPRRGGDITRDEYIERAKQNAERRFDRMDADHDGILTGEERRAYRESHARRRGAAPAAGSQ